MCYHSLMLKYTEQQRKEYIHFTRKLGASWVEIFEGNTEFYSTAYWDVLSEMWYAGKPLMVSDALKFMRSIKSPFTARKYLQKLIDEAMIVESKNPKDERSMLVSLSADMKEKLDKFFDNTICEMIGTSDSIKS